MEHDIHPSFMGMSLELDLEQIAHVLAVDEQQISRLYLDIPRVAYPEGPVLAGLLSNLLQLLDILVALQVVAYKLSTRLLSHQERYIR